MPGIAAALAFVALASAAELPTAAPGRGPIRPPGQTYVRPAAPSSTVTGWPGMRPAPAASATANAPSPRPWVYGSPAASSTAFGRPGGPYGLSRPGAPIQVQQGEEAWGDAPPGMPPGAKTAVLEGNPRMGLFTIRVRIPAGYKLPAHWHPADERVTVLSGSVKVAFGERFDTAAPGAKTFKAGAYYVNPAQSRHFVWTEEGAELQITGMGPWEVIYANPADDPRAGKAPPPAVRPGGPPPR